MLRKDILDFKAILESLLQITDPTELVLGHPALMLVQTLVDVTDPIAYGPHFQHPEDGGPPLDLLLTSGVHDVQTAAITAVNLAAAAHMPILTPAPLSSPVHDILGLGEAEKPLVGNVSNDSGTATSALGQFGADDDDHFIIFNNPKATALYRDFLSSALTEDPPVIK